MATFTDTAGENLVAGNLCYRKSDGKLWKAKADSVNTMLCIGMAAESISADATGNFYKFGEITLTSHGFTVGSKDPLFVSAATAGAITQTPPATSGNQVQSIGTVKDANTIWFFPNLVVVEVA